MNYDDLTQLDTDNQCNYLYKKRNHRHNFHGSISPDIRNVVNHINVIIRKLINIIGDHTNHLLLSDYVLLPKLFRFNKIIEQLKPLSLYN